MAMRKCYCAPTLALRRRTTVLVRRRRRPGAARMMLVIPERRVACLGADPRIPQVVATTDIQCQTIYQWILEVREMIERPCFPKDPRAAPLVQTGRSCGNACLPYREKLHRRL